MLTDWCLRHRKAFSTLPEEKSNQYHTNPAPHNGDVLASYIGTTVAQMLWE